MDTHKLSAKTAEGLKRQMTIELAIQCILKSEPICLPTLKGELTFLQRQGFEGFENDYIPKAMHPPCHM